MTPEAMANAIASGRRPADGHAGDQIAQEFVAIVVAQQQYGFRQPRGESRTSSSDGTDKR